MSRRTLAIWGGVAAGVLAIGTGAVLGASHAPALGAMVADAGLRFYWRVLSVARDLSPGFLLPVIALSVSFHIGWRVGRRVPRQAHARAAVAPQQASAMRLVILFALASVASALVVAAQSLR